MFRISHICHIMFYYVQNFTQKFLTDFQVVKNSLNPEWKTFEIKAQKLCAANYDVQLKVHFIIFILLVRVCLQFNVITLLLFNIIYS